MINNHSVGIIGNNSFEKNNDTVFRCFVFTNSDSLKVLMIIAYSIVMATSVLGKTILAVVYRRNKSIKNTVNCCIMNMAFALFYRPRTLARIVIGLEWLVEVPLDSYSAKSCLCPRRFQSAYPS